MSLLSIARSGRGIIESSASVDVIMLRVFKYFLLVFACVAIARQASAFSLGGAPEGWQVQDLGHNLAGDIAASKNLGEEYRWPAPIYTYGFDSSFINYFGTNGMKAVDDSMAALNALRPVSTYRRDLTDVPLRTRFENYTASSLGLIDIKTTTLGVMTEKLGLFSPNRAVWSLRSRETVGDPPSTNYLVIQRNFNPVTLAPDAYVNGIRHTFTILEFDNPRINDAWEDVFDPKASLYSPVASLIGGAFGRSTIQSLSVGVYHSGLTRDDVGGLRYLYSTNNINVEPLPATTQVFLPDRANLVLMTNLDLTLFSARTLTNSLPALQNLYPGLSMASAKPRFTNTLSVTPVVTTNTITLGIVTNRSLIQVITNQDLALFSSFSRTSSPTALLAQYPGLAITQTNSAVEVTLDPLSVFLTNAPRMPWDDTFFTNFILVTNYVTNLTTVYDYAFSNVITNYYGAQSLVRRVSSGLLLEPWSTPNLPIFKTNSYDIIAPRVAGGIIIIPPGLAGYEFTGFSTTNLTVSTNIVLSTNFISGGFLRPILDYELTYFTNAQYAVYPVEILANGIVTNFYTTNYVTRTEVYSDFNWRNTITNYSSPTTPIVTDVVTITPNPSFPAFSITNRSQTPGSLALPSGGFLVDTNSTGFDFAGLQFTNLVPVTNILSDVTDPVTKVRTRVEVVYIFTNVVYGVYPFTLQPTTAALRPGVDKITFMRVDADSLLSGVWNITNRFQMLRYTNNLVVTNIYQTAQTLPDILFTAQDLGIIRESVPLTYVRSANYQNNAALNSTTQGGGPGTITPTSIVSFSTLLPSLWRENPGLITEEADIFSRFQYGLWGYFDGTTNPPVVFPKDITLEQLENLVLGRP